MRIAPFSFAPIRRAWTARAAGRGERADLIGARPAPTSYNRVLPKGRPAPFFIFCEPIRVPGSGSPAGVVQNQPRRRPNKNESGPTMLNSLLTRVFGSRNERLLRQLQRS